MEEIYRGIFRQTIDYPGQMMPARNLLVIKQPGRSLMVDTAMNLPKDLKFVETMLAELEIRYRDLDIFITHDHPDHSGLVSLLASRGARIFMNPGELNRRADLWHCYLSDEKTRKESLRIVGVAPEITPDVYQVIMEYTDRAHKQAIYGEAFDFIPVRPGRTLTVGEYHFRVIALPGHTNGQCGLFEPKHRLLFCGDQIMTDIVPIVGTQYKNWSMLRRYLNSLRDLVQNYSDCQFMTSHYRDIEDVKKEADRIIFGYMDKCTIMKQVLEESERPLTVRDVGARAYGLGDGPPDYQHFISSTHIWVKTFSCLEYLYEEGFAVRKEQNGILYWSASK